jgi:hypothetical protein
LWPAADSKAAQLVSLVPHSVPISQIISGQRRLSNAGPVVFGVRQLDIARIAEAAISVPEVETAGAVAGIVALLALTHTQRSVPTNPITDGMPNAAELRF